MLLHKIPPSTTQQKLPSIYCRFWTYNSREKTCFLKSKRPQLRASADFISGSTRDDGCGRLQTLFSQKDQRSLHAIKLEKKKLQTFPYTEDFYFPIQSAHQTKNWTFSFMLLEPDPPCLPPKEIIDGQCQLPLPEAAAPPPPPATTLRPTFLFPNLVTTTASPAVVTPELPVNLPQPPRPALPPRPLPTLPTLPPQIASQTFLTPPVVTSNFQVNEFGYIS